MLVIIIRDYDNLFQKAWEEGLDCCTIGWLVNQTTASAVRVPRRGCGSTITKTTNVPPEAERAVYCTRKSGTSIPV